MYEICFQNERLQNYMPVTRVGETRRLGRRSKKKKKKKTVSTCRPEKLLSERKPFLAGPTGLETKFRFSAIINRQFQPPSAAVKQISDGRYDPQNRDRREPNREIEIESACPFCISFQCVLCACAYVPTVRIRSHEQKKMKMRMRRINSS